MPMMRPRSASGTSALTAASLITNSMPLAAPWISRSGNHSQGSTRQAIESVVRAPNSSAAWRQPVAPRRRTRVPRNGATTKMPSPCTAALAPINASDQPCALATRAASGNTMASDEPASVEVAMTSAMSRHAGGRSATSAGTRAPPAGSFLPGGSRQLGAARAFVRLETEGQRADYRVGVGELNPHDVAEPEGFAVALADQRVVKLVEHEHVIAQGRDRDQALGTSLVEGDEQTEDWAPVTRPANTAPTRLPRKRAMKRSMTRRSASMARRSQRER